MNSPKKSQKQKLDRALLCSVASVVGFIVLDHIARSIYPSSNWLKLVLGLAVELCCVVTLSIVGIAAYRWLKAHRKNAEGNARLIVTPILIGFFLAFPAAASTQEIAITHHTATEPKTVVQPAIDLFRVYSATNYDVMMVALEDAQKTMTLPLYGARVVNEPDGVFIQTSAGNFKVSSVGPESWVLMGPDKVLYGAEPIHPICYWVAAAVAIGVGAYYGPRVWRCIKTTISNYNRQISNAMEEASFSPPLPPLGLSNTAVALSAYGLALPPNVSLAVSNVDSQQLYQNISALCLTNWTGNLVKDRYAVAVGYGDVFAVDRFGVAMPVHLTTTTNGDYWYPEPEPEVTVGWVSFSRDNIPETTAVLYFYGHPVATNWMIGGRVVLSHTSGPPVRTNVLQLWRVDSQ